MYAFVRQKRTYEKSLSFLLFWRTKSGFSMAAVRAKCTANVAEPDLRLSCTVTVPMCAKPIAGSAGLFGVHFAFTVDVQTKRKPFYSGKKVQSKPTEVPWISRYVISRNLANRLLFQALYTAAKQSKLAIETTRVYPMILCSIMFILLIQLLVYIYVYVVCTYANLRWTTQ